MPDPPERTASATACGIDAAEAFPVGGEALTTGVPDSLEGGAGFRAGSAAEEKFPAGSPR